MQGEAAVVIIAQTIPVIRVLLLPYVSSVDSNSRRASSLRETGTKTANRSREGMPADPTESKARSIALVQLSSGKIVRSDSEEGRAFQNLGATAHEASATTAEPSENLFTGAQDQDEAAAPAGRDTADVDDEVHKIWQDMGLSKRAWSKSPSPPPGRASVARR